MIGGRKRKPFLVFIPIVPFSSHVFFSNLFFSEEIGCAEVIHFLLLLPIANDVCQSTEMDLLDVANY